MFVLASCLFLGCNYVQGGPCTIGQVQSYIALGAAGCTAGVYTFYNFGFSQSETGGSSLPPLDSITIDPRVADTTILAGSSGSASPITGMLLLGDWNLVAGQSVMYSLSFSIELTDGGNLSGDAHLGWTPYQFPASFPSGNTFGSTSIVGFNSGQITDQSIFHYSQDCTPCPGGGVILPLVAGVYDPVSMQFYDLSQTPFLNIQTTMLLQDNSGSVQDLGMFDGIVPAQAVPEPRNLLPLGLILLGRLRVTLARPKTPVSPRR